MLPPPVCVKPCRVGTTSALRAPSVMLTGGADGAGACADRNASDPSTVAALSQNLFIFPPSLPTKNHVHGRGEKSAPALERPRIGVVVVANLRANNDVLARPEGDARGQRGVQAGEARALAVDVVEKLQPR